MMIIQERKQHFATSVNEKLDENGYIKLTFSVGWLKKLKKGRKFCTLRMHGKYGDGGESFVAIIFPFLQESTAKNHFRYLFDCDKFVLCWKLSPDCTTVNHIFLRQQKLKYC